MRAADQRRAPEERIVDDPYAKLFLGAMMRAALGAVEATGRLGERTEQLFPGLSTYVLTRHRFMDDALVRAATEGHERSLEQVILLGAGYDTRGYRFADQLAGLEVFEVDHPSTAKRKAQIVRDHPDAFPATNVQTVEIDFETQELEERLLSAGVKRGARTFVVWEGVSMYLTRKAVQGTLTTLRKLLAPGSELVMDYWFLLDAPDLISTAHRMSANLLHLLGEPMTFGIHPEDVGGFLDRVGWDVVELAGAEDLERRYVKDGRSVYPAIYVTHLVSRSEHPEQPSHP